MGFWDSLIDWLDQYQADPVTYLLLFFLFCVAASIILPIPVEILLVVPGVPFVYKAIVMGLGKGVGAIAVFYIGAEIEQVVRRFSKWRWFKWLLDKSEIFVRRYGYVAMYIIMSIPGMVDTIPLYIFSIMNKEGELMTLKGFAIVNVLAGMTRAALIYALFYIFNIQLFG